MNTLCALAFLSITPVVSRLDVFQFLSQLLMPAPLSFITKSASKRAHGFAPGISPLPALVPAASTAPLFLPIPAAIRVNEHFAMGFGGMRVRDPAEFTDSEESEEE